MLFPSEENNSMVVPTIQSAVTSLKLFAPDISWTFTAAPPKPTLTNT